MIQRYVKKNPKTNKDILRLESNFRNILILKIWLKDPKDVKLCDASIMNGKHTSGYVQSVKWKYHPLKFYEHTSVRVITNHLSILAKNANKFLSRTTISNDIIENIDINLITDAKFVPNFFI